MKSYNAICIATALTLIGLTGNAIADGVWISDANGCKVWDPSPKKNETVTWSGSCAGGYAEGSGTLQWVVDGTLSTTLEGNFSGGKVSGKVKETFTRGDSFEGEFVDDLPQGKGIRIFVDGARYEGDFLAGKRTGKGAIAFKNGNRYEGDFVDGKLTGKGVFTWANGTRYTGDMTDGRPNGKGAMKHASGDNYEGDFVVGKRSGKGTYTSASGDRYEGGFVDDRQEGNGTTVFANGDRYEGSYSNGQFNGEGKMQYSRGDRYEGSWKAGAQDGAGTIFYHDGHRVDGIFPSGDMTMTAAKDWVERPASFNASNCAPSYSKAAMGAKEEGTARVQFEIDAFGKLQSAAIVKSSGFADLDQATIAALSHCKFKPAIKGDKLVAATLLTDYEWKLSHKVSPILTQLKGDEGLVMIDIMVVTSKNFDNPVVLHILPRIKAGEVWLKNMATNEEYAGMFNSARGEYGVAFVVVPEGMYCLDGFSTNQYDYQWCKGPQIRVSKGVINNAGEWWFAKLAIPSGHSARSVDFKMIGVQENPTAVFQRAVNQHPELFEN